VYLLRTSIGEIFSRSPELINRPIGLVGIGEKAFALTRALHAFKNKIYYFGQSDESSKLPDNVDIHGKFDAKLSACGVVILLRPETDETLKKILPHVHANMVILSENQPEISHSHWQQFNQAGAQCYEVSASYPEFKQYPDKSFCSVSLIPGDLLDPILHLWSGETFSSQPHFNQMVIEQGFTMSLTLPKGVSHSLIDEDVILVGADPDPRIKTTEPSAYKTPSPHE